MIYKLPARSVYFLILRGNINIIPNVEVGFSTVLIGLDPLLLLYIRGFLLDFLLNLLYLVRVVAGFSLL